MHSTHSWIRLSCFGDEYVGFIGGNPVITYAWRSTCLKTDSNALYRPNMRPTESYAHALTNACCRESCIANEEPPWLTGGKNHSLSDVTISTNLNRLVIKYRSARMVSSRDVHQSRHRMIYEPLCYGWRPDKTFSTLANLLSTSWCNYRSKVWVFLWNFLVLVCFGSTILSFVRP